MARPKQPLDAVYGKLTVLAELPANKVKVRCDCGTEKLVHRSNLRSGRVTSCGGPGCRATSDGPRTRGPAWIRHHLIPELYASLVDASTTVADVAQHYDVHEQTVYTLMHAVNAAGGIDPYMASLAPPSRAGTLPPKTRPKPAPKPVPVRPLTRPGVVPPPPPSKWQAKKA